MSEHSGERARTTLAEIGQICICGNTLKLVIRLPLRPGYEVRSFSCEACFRMTRVVADARFDA